MNGRLALPTSVSVAVRTLDRNGSRRLAAFLLGPVAATVYAIAVWRFASDMNWFGEFFITDGLFSRWQIWLALAIATQMAAHQLRRRAGR
jgi:hypothetical protein